MATGLLSGLAKEKQITVRVTDDLYEWAERLQEEGRFRSNAHAAEEGMKFLREVREMGLDEQEALRALESFARAKQQKMKELTEEWEARFSPDVVVDDEGDPVNDRDA